MITLERLVPGGAEGVNDGVLCHAGHINPHVQGVQVPSVVDHLKLVSQGPSASCRTDYLSCTFKTHSQDQEDGLYAFVYSLAEWVLPVGGFLEPKKGRYFDRVYQHPSGISLEITPVSSDRATRGMSLVNIPGAVWGALDDEERRDAIVDLRFMPGFVRCTRWDPQQTVLNPAMTIEQLVREVDAGMWWPTRFRSWSPYQQRDRDGGFVKSPTGYWGTPDSDVQLRIYDHGVQHDWSVPSLRIEAQIRKETADQHFRRLADRCKSEGNETPLFIHQEATTVKDALTQHADIRDTSEWAGRPKPRKWAQKAPRAPWLVEMLDHKETPLKRQYAAELTWDRTMDAMVDQYGRKFFLWASREALVRKVSTAQVLDEFRTRCATKLQKGDDSLLASQVPAAAAEVARETVRRSTARAALIEEGREDLLGTKPPMGNTGVKVPSGPKPEVSRDRASGATFSDTEPKTPTS